MIRGQSGSLSLTNRRRVTILGAAGLAAVWLAATAGLAAAAETALGPPVDPAATVGPETCAKCHDLEYQVWRGTAHARLYESDGEELHQRKRAQEIAAALGVRPIKGDSLCLHCHYTPRLSGTRVTVRAGVSCESCHGAAAGWINVHNTFEGRQVHRAAETSEQSRRRRERNAAAGMFAPGRIYDLASRCYACHAVPDQRLVEVGGHTRGGEFDLAARIDAIRHDFVTGDRQDNPPLSVERRRQLRVVGAALELEWALRGLAAAGSEGPYSRGLARRASSALRDLERLGKRVEVPEIAAMVGAGSGLELAAGHADELAYAAGKVAAAGRGFAAAHDGSRLAALDSMLGGGAEEEASEVAEGGGESGEAPGGELVAAADGGSPAAGGGGRRGTRTGGGGAAGGGPAAPAGAAGSASVPAPEGALQARLRPPLSNRKVVGQGRCDACHNSEAKEGAQNDWWYQDAHSRSAEPFFDRRRINVQIATVYYGKPAAELMATGKAVCMDCHGTVVTGREAGEADSGVSCESCHGPAGDYLKPHPEAARARRLELGMVDLDDAGRRAAVCASCHWIVDPRLLSSGHPSGRGGKGFDPVDRLRRIEHWKGGQPPAAAVRSAWSQAVAARGGVPEVRVVALDGGGGSGGAAGGGDGAGGTAGDRGGSAVPAGAGGGSRARGERTARPETPSAPAWGGGPPEAAPAAEIDLEPLPSDLADRPLAELLAAVQRRLDEIWAQVGAGAASAAGGGGR